MDFFSYGVYGLVVTLNETPCMGGIGKIDNSTNKTCLKKLKAFWSTYFYKKLDGGNGLQKKEIYQLTL